MICVVVIAAGVIGKELSNPIPRWAEHGADRKVVPCGVSTGMDSPNPEPGRPQPGAIVITLNRVTASHPISF